MPLRKKKIQDRWLILIVMLSLVPLFQNMSPFEKANRLDENYRPRKTHLIEDRQIKKELRSRALEIRKTPTLKAPPELGEILNIHLDENLTVTREGNTENLTSNYLNPR